MTLANKITLLRAVLAMAKRKQLSKLGVGFLVGFSYDKVSFVQIFDI